MDGVSSSGCITNISYSLQTLVPGPNRLQILLPALIKACMFKHVQACLQVISMLHHKRWQHMLLPMTCSSLWSYAASYPHLSEAAADRHCCYFACSAASWWAAPPNCMKCAVRNGGSCVGVGAHGRLLAAHDWGSLLCMCAFSSLMDSKSLLHWPHRLASWHILGSSCQH